MMYYRLSTIFPDVLIYCNAFQFSENNKAEKKGKFLTLQKF